MSNAQAASQAQEGIPDPRNRPWLRHYDPAVPATITYPAKPLTWLLDEAARAHGNRDAMIFYGHRFTYRQLAAMVDRFAGALVNSGVKPGDRVSIALPNIPQFPVAFYGALKAGAVAVPTNPIYTEAELQHQLADAGAETIIVLDLLYPKLHKVRANTPIKHIIVAGVQDYLPPLLAAGYTLQQRRNKQAVSKGELRADPTVHQFKELLGKADDRWYELHALPEPAKPDDVAVLQYTGGTTGLSKGAMLTHRNLLANAIQAWAWTEEAKKPEVILCAAPFFHSYGLTVAMNTGIWSGSTLVLMPRYKARDALKMIEKY